MRSGQRSANRQPAAGSIAADATPLRTSIRSRVVGGRVGNRLEQQARVRMQGALEHALCRALLDDLPRVHDEHVVRDVTRAGEIVGDVEEREVLVLLQVEHQVENADADRDVEHRGRLVGHEHGRLHGERSRDRDALPLAARQLVRVLVDVALGRHQPDRRQQLVDVLVDVCALRDAVDLQGAGEMVVDRLDRVQRSERILEDHLHLRPVMQDVAAATDVRHVLALEEDAATRRLVQAGEHARHGALAAAALADERGDRARAQREGDVVDGMQAAAADEAVACGEVLRQSADLDRP